MGDQVYMLKDGEQAPVEVSGNLSVGWFGGTWVKYTSAQPSFTRAIATVERSVGTGTMAGFLMYGSQHNNPIELPSDLFNIDTLQREGGDFARDWTSTEAGGINPVFDSEGLLQKLGTRVVTMNVAPTGFFKFYIFEVNNKAERTTPGGGAALSYVNNDQLFVSDRGLLTKEQESGSHTWSGYVVASQGNDFEGDFLIVTAAVI